MQFKFSKVRKRSLDSYRIIFMALAAIPVSVCMLSNLLFPRPVNLAGNFQMLLFKIWRIGTLTGCVIRRKWMRILRYVKGTVVAPFRTNARTSVVGHRSHFPDSAGTWSCAKFMRQTCVFLLPQDKKAVEKQLHDQIIVKAVQKYTQVRAFICSPEQLAICMTLMTNAPLTLACTHSMATQPNSSCPHHYAHIQ